MNKKGKENKFVCPTLKLACREEGDSIDFQLTLHGWGIVENQHIIKNYKVVSRI
jgi:hypothetical protein